MRRVLLGAFLFLAACGGGLKSENPQAADPGADAMAERAQFLMTRAAQQAIGDIARTADPDALEACLNAYVDDVGGSGGPGEGPVQKPSVAQLQGFLLQCLAGHVPHDLRANRGQDAVGSANAISHSDISITKYIDKSSSNL